MISRGIEERLLKLARSFKAVAEMGPRQSGKTLKSYLNALRRIFVIEDVPAWQPSLRSKTAMRAANKGLTKTTDQW